jgi:hypothetical protein
VSHSICYVAWVIASGATPSDDRVDGAKGDHFDHGVIILITKVIKMITCSPTRVTSRHARSRRQSPEAEAVRGRRTVGDAVS